MYLKFYFKFMKILGSGTCQQSTILPQGQMFLSLYAEKFQYNLFYIFEMYSSLLLPIAQQKFLLSLNYNF
jgi:hypothetical protein